MVPTRSLSIAIYDRIAGLALLDRVQRRITAGAPSDRERLDALMRWSHENVVPQSAGPDRIIPDDFLSIVRRGHGYCDQSAHVLAVLARLAGYDARLLFLRAPDSTSPHTVAEVRVDSRWILIDPWLGLVLTDDSGRLQGVEHLRSQPEILHRYERVSAGGASFFERGTRFRAFPYANALEVIRNARVGRTRRAASLGGAEGPRPGDEAIVRMDAARWAHLEGRYAEAIRGYRELLRMELPSDMRAAIRFFVGLALTRFGAPDEAEAAFADALAVEPEGPWAPSIRELRMEAAGQPRSILP